MTSAAGGSTARASDGPRLAVMVNGLPGRMAAATAEEVVHRGHTLVGEVMTGAGMDASYAVTPEHVVRLCGPDDHDACLQRVSKAYDNIMIVDYTHPTAANANVSRYARAGLSFVIGTTGGVVEDMMQAVNDVDDVYAVIAPNMGKQIVAFQAMMRQMADQFPTVFQGYTLSVTESHQATKADTSGTAKAVVKSISDMGVQPFEVGDIDKVRTVDRSVADMGVPEEFVTKGHAYHTYRLTSQDGSVNFEYQHNVCGRRVYAEGTVDAVQFLAAIKRSGKQDKRIYDMIDVLRSGSMS